MGMAASQARYIELTARKTNVEYEGQQINEQRTSLANQSAGLFNQLLTLNVPTPPNTNDFTTVQYTFSDGANNDTITNIQPLEGDPNYNKTVTYTYNQTVNKGIGQTRTDLGVNLEGTTYWLTNGGTKLNQTKLNQCTVDTNNPNYSGTDVAALTQICIDNPTSTMRDALDYDEDTQTITLASIGNAYKYTNPNGTTYFYSDTDLNAGINLTNPGAATNLTGYYDTQIQQAVTTTSKAYVAQADGGRYSSITLENYTASFPLTATTKTDTAAYDNAMNNFEYQNQLYAQETSNINARTEIIQQEDRTLEMKLKQLDTEQEALNTEMESVKKVIDKNIEQTFKTFQ